MRSEIYMSGDKKDDDDGDIGVVLETKPKTKRPPLYKVLILNDDFTPMEFVVMVLERFFGMTHAEAFDSARRCLGTRLCHTHVCRRPSQMAHWICLRVRSA